MSDQTVRLHQVDDRPELDLREVRLGPPPEALLTRFRVSGEVVLAYTLLWSATGQRPGTLKRIRASDVAARFRKDPAAGRSWLKTLEGLGLIVVTPQSAGEKNIHTIDPEAAYAEYCRQNGLQYVPADPQRLLPLETDDKSEDIEEEAPTAGGYGGGSSDQVGGYRGGSSESEDIEEEAPTSGPSHFPKTTAEKKAYDDARLEAQSVIRDCIDSLKQRAARENDSAERDVLRARTQDPRPNLNQDPRPKDPDPDSSASADFAQSVEQALERAASRDPFSDHDELADAQNLHRAVADPALSIEFCVKVVQAIHDENPDGQSRLPLPEVHRILRALRRQQRLGKLRESPAAYFTSAIMARYAELNHRPWPRSRHPP